MTKMRVGIQPFILSGIAGYRVRWTDGRGVRHAYFVQTLGGARTIKARVKEGRDVGSRWAVKC